MRARVLSGLAATGAARQATPRPPTTPGSTAVVPGTRRGSGGSAPPPTPAAP